MGFLVSHELGGVCKVAVAYVTSEKGISQYALFIFCRVAQLEVTLFAFMITEDYVAFDALQGELRCWRDTRPEENYFMNGTHLLKSENRKISLLLLFLLSGNSDFDTWTQILKQQSFLCIFLCHYYLCYACLCA